MNVLRALLVDDSASWLDTLSGYCQMAGKVDIVGAFTSPGRALKCAEQNAIDLAFIEVNMTEMSGLDLGRALRQINPQIILVYVSGENEQCAQAMSMQADDYIFKPYGYERIAQAIDKALLLRPRLDLPPKLNVRTFGKFEVWVGNEHVHLPNAKGRELLALCVDRCGSAVAMDEAIELLWPSKPMDERVQRLYRKAIGDTRKALAPYGASRILETRWKCCWVQKDRIECDYFDFLEGKPGVWGKPQRYMMEYSWGEATIGKMCTMSRNRIKEMHVIENL